MPKPQGQIMLILILLFTFSASANWQTYLDREVFRGQMGEHFPDAQYLKLPWRPSSDITFEQRPLQPESLHQLHLPDSTELWPTHPQQTTKDYLHAVVAVYDHRHLPAASPACATTDTRGRFCLRPTWANSVVMSDTFIDKRNNRYRGYWVVNYLQTHDNMGTLLSKGRTVYPRPSSQFANDQIEGSTYGLKARDFLFLTDLLPADIAKISKERNRALTKDYRLQGLRFVRQ